MNRFRFHFSLRNYMLWLTLLPLLVMAVSFATFFLRHQFSVMEAVGSRSIDGSATGNQQRICSVFQ